MGLHDFFVCEEIKFIAINKPETNKKLETTFLLFQNKLNLGDRHLEEPPRHSSIDKFNMKSVLAKNFLDIDDLGIDDEDYIWMCIMNIYTDYMNSSWFEQYGCSLLLNEQEKISITNLAKRLDCSIDFTCHFYYGGETLSSSREIYMFDGRKVFEETTKYKYGDKNYPLNKDFGKKKFIDVIKTEYVKSKINMDLVN